MTQFYRKSCPDNNEGHVQAFQIVMSQILALHEPLPLGALIKQIPLGLVDANNINSVLTHMESLLSGITNHLIPIRPLHSSFHDYLANPKHSKKFYIAPKAQLMMEQFGKKQFVILPISNLKSMILVSPKPPQSQAFSHLKMAKICPLPVKSFIG
jgi:hypothetical protein